jgi:ADP-ribose pyrophosphatase
LEETISSKIAFDGRAVRLRIDTVRTADGRESTREVVEHGDCVAIIPIDDNNNILLVNQFRKAIEKELLEVPAGGIEPGETPEAAVRREMQEETGYLPRKIQKLVGFYSAPGYCTEYLHVYLATDLVPGRLFAEDTKGIKVVRVPVGQVLPLITSGKVCDGKSIAGLLVFLGHRKAPR